MAMQMHSRLHTARVNSNQSLLILEAVRTRLNLPTVFLNQPKQIIGSDPQSAVHLDMPGVNSRHCIIICGPTRCVLKACDPRTWLNNGPVKEATLRDGDVLTIGPVEFRIRKATPDEVLKSLHSEPAADRDSRAVSESPSATTDNPPDAPISKPHLQHATPFEPNARIAPVSQNPRPTAAAEVADLAEAIRQTALQREMQTQLTAVAIRIADQTQELEKIREAARREEADLQARRRVSEQAAKELAIAQQRQALVIELESELSRHAEQLLAHEITLTQTADNQRQRDRELSNSLANLAAQQAALDLARVEIHDREQHFLAEQRTKEFRQQQIFDRLKLRRTRIAALKAHVQQRAEELERLHATLQVQRETDVATNRDEAERLRQEVDEAYRQAEARIERVQSEELRLEAVRAKLAKDQQTLEEASAELRRNQEKCEEQQRELSRSRQNLDESISQTRIRQQELSVRETQLASLTAGLNDRESSLRQEQAAVEAERTEIVLETQRLKDRQQEIESLTFDQVGREADLVNREQALDLKAELQRVQERELDGILAEVQAAAETQRVTTEEISQAAELARDRAAELAAREERLATSQHEIQTARAALLAEQQALAEQTRNTSALILNLREEQARFDREARKLELETAELNEERASLQAEWRRFHDDCDRQASTHKPLRRDVTSDETLASAKQDGADDRPNEAPSNLDAVADLPRGEDRLRTLQEELAADRERLNVDSAQLLNERQRLNERADLLDEQSECVAEARLRLVAEQNQLGVESKRLQEALAEFESRQASARERIAESLAEDIEAVASIPVGPQLLTPPFPARDAQDLPAELDFEDWPSSAAEAQSENAPSLISASDDSAMDDSASGASATAPSDCSQPESESALTSLFERQPDFRPSSETSLTDPETSSPLVEPLKQEEFQLDLADHPDLLLEPPGTQSNDLPHQNLARDLPTEDPLTDLAAHLNQPPADSPIPSVTPARVPDFRTEVPLGQTDGSSGEHEAVEEDWTATLARSLDLPLAEALQAEQRPSPFSSLLSTKGSGSATAPAVGSLKPENDAPEAEANVDLRLALAKMFDLAPEVLERHAQGTSASQSAPADSVTSLQVPEEPAAELQAEAPLEFDATTVDDSAARSLEIAKEPDPQEPVAAPRKTDYELEDTDPDSISSYMERLLARSRRDASAASEKPESASAGNHGSAHRSSAPAAPIAYRQEPVPAPVSAGAASEPQASPELPPSPRPRHNVLEMRADISSLREVANFSARSAVAKHTWKKERRTMQVQLVLTAASLGYAGVLFGGALPGAPTSYGWAATCIGGLMGSHLFRSWWRIKKMRDGANSARTSQIPTTGAETTGHERNTDESSPTAAAVDGRAVSHDA